MLLDDILSPLDAKTALFIVNETLLKALRHKTILMATHAIQYIKFGDYIYIVDGGRIKEEGAYEEVIEGELIQKFKELEEVSKTRTQNTKN